MDQQVTYQTPLRLFWWKGVPNFGDALSRIVVEHVSGRTVEHSGVGGAQICAVGSILQIVRRKFAEGGKHRPWIWGSGLLHHVPRDFLKHVDIALLRGPVTASLLGLKPKAFGDPGLLIANALGDRPERGDVIGLVPHHTQLDDPQIRALVDADPRLQLIDVRDDAETVCRAIGACAHVCASSLHGLVTADAYGVPSTWMDPGEQSHFKYHDYAASIGRAMITPLAWKDIPSQFKTLTNTQPLPHADGIALAQEALRDSFPAPLRATTVSGVN
ncbi:MAG: polysaccharide pyruvyl transferase family protein [Rhodobacteraceae bacterium]|nr:polysaccharide pyruvyl transferase family protein [Paracoccaceae bacterium]